MAENRSHRLAVELCSAWRAAGQLRDTLRNLRYAMEVSPASDPQTPFEVVRASLLVPWRREMKPLLSDLGEATAAAAALLRDGAGRVADGESWQGAEAWSARLFRRVESVPASMASLDAWCAALAEEGTTYGFTAGFPNALASSRLDAEAEAAADLAAALGEAFDTLYACIETSPPAPESLASMAVGMGIIAPPTPDPETPPFRSAEWFRKKTGDQLDPDTLRKAGEKGRLQRERGNGNRWHYPVPQVRRLWPQFAPMIDRALSSEE
ncbi:MAG: hypothetical protein LAT64_03555 [Phycisphaerales bacterium]|nr:hypothetical protein [Planctomycetota bacterium]MCH8507827.1 hypothetical protein [Phycisphaerales bacterium]